MRIVLATFGSLGDLHPFLAVALELRARGHHVTIATHELYRPKVERAGLAFHPLRPDYDPSDRTANRLAMHRWRGPEYILKSFASAVPETFEDLRLAVTSADLLVNHTVVFAGPLVAEETGIRWVSTVLAPIALFSASDPSYAFPIEWMNRVMLSHPALVQAVRVLAWNATLRWLEPVQQLRRELGLPAGRNPMVEGQHSPFLSLALFSPAFAQPQPDWPQNMEQTGFPFYDTETEFAPDLARFLEEGGAPIVFTLGSAAVINPGEFFQRSFEAARLMGCRAVLIAGPEADVRPSRDIFVTGYAPYGLLFPRAAAIVHQGGIGTTAQALRAGRPSLIVPFANDQPDNAARVVRLGAARTVSRTRYTTDAAELELGMLLGNPSYTAAAESVAEAIHAENGARAAADAILRQ